MAHTPGPWEAKPTYGRIVLNGSSIYGVADITGEFAGWNPDDLLLMAAAPELLAVCKAIASDLSMFQFTDGEYRLSEQSAGVILQSLREAIAKAEGRTDEE